MRILFVMIYMLVISCNAALASSRIKDIVDFEGIRENMLLGYGLVVGLNGTGDNLSNAAFTQKGLMDFLTRLGINTNGSNAIKTKNLAAVTITATLPAFARQGSKIDVTVSTLGDSKSLQGGTLLATPLLGADGEVYAVAQGAISIANFVPAAKISGTASRGVLTNGFVPNGAIIEREIDFQLSSLDSVKLALKNPDLTTSLNIAEAINSNFHMDLAKSLDPGTVELQVPEYQKDDIMKLLARVEQIEIKTDKSAKIIIEEASGTIVIGDNVAISPVAISQGNLSIVIKEASGVVLPPPADQDKGKKLYILNKTATLSDLVDGLNTLGVNPRDLITILQNIKAAGALQADLEVH